ncbi:unnamed protein product [Adineta steineri]|uniref:Uncharacterized protein n=3 Tax=Adineta steineri TaxID=433720 RepID=A0A815JMT4_9BILA|nr:unnamed protein product [Adineta steineri]
MQFIQESTNEFNKLLVATVHKDDVTSLKIQLLSESNPDLYLNQIYDEPHEQKCTLLMIACLNGNEDMVYMLLNCFKPNLEILNVIKINNDGESSTIYKNVTVLWAAASMNHLKIVKQLVEHGANVNHTTNMNSTPIRCACYHGNVKMVRYLIEKGANIKTAKKKNDTNLSLSIYRKHLTMTYYLVDELGCDVNECDNDGYSPLYFAVKCQSILLVHFLLSRGARNFPSTNDHMSPLMLAAEERCTKLIEAIGPYCSLLERIEAEELLGSSFACAEHGQCDLQQSFEHFCRALELRSFHNLPKHPTNVTREIFNYREECQTIDQLKELQVNLDNMFTEAFLVRERLLGPTSESYHYSIIYRGATLADDAQYEQAINFWLFDLELHREYSTSIDSYRLRQFSSIFSEMITGVFPVSINAILTLMSAVVTELKHNIEGFDENLHTVLYLITIISQSSIDVCVSSAHRKIFNQLIQSINKNRYVVSNSGSSLLHLCLSDTTSIFKGPCKYPCVHTVRTLLKCGADVNAMNFVRDTPLHIFVRNSSDCDETIFQLLCDAGAHLDYMNALRKMPIDIVLNPNTKRLVKEKMKLNLKCLCARLIQKNAIPFHGKICTSLINFVEKH